MNDVDMMTEIIKELKPTIHINEIISTQLLCWTRRVKTWRAQKSIKNDQTQKNNKEFYAINKHEEKTNTNGRKETDNKCKYCRNTYDSKKVSSLWEELPKVYKSESLWADMQKLERQVSKEGRRKWCVYCTLPYWRQHWYMIVCIFYYYAQMNVIYSMCPCLNMWKWCTLADCIHDSYWLYYIQ